MLSLRATARLGRIALTAVAIWLGYRIVAWWRPNERDRWLGAMLFRSLNSLGGIFIKAGQILATRHDVLPSAITASLSRLQDRAAPLPARAIFRVCEQALGRDWERHFSYFEAVPVAAGNIAQVHRARLRGNGQVVAVKVRRPGIGRRLDLDARILLRLAGLIARWSSFRDVPVERIARQVTDALRSQVDFAREAEYNAKLRSVFASVPAVTVPRLVSELCTEKIMTMEYVEGCRLDDPSLQDEAAQVKSATEVLLHSLYRMLFTFGIVHCDVHPGNVLRQGRSVVLLDFGFMAELSATDLDLFRRFFCGMVFGDGRECARILIESALSRSHECDVARFTEEIDALITSAVAQNALNFEVSRFALALFEKQRRFGLYSSPNFAMAIYALLVFEGIAKQVHPELDFQALAVPFFSVTILHRLAR